MEWKDISSAPKDGTKILVIDMNYRLGPNVKCKWWNNNLNTWFMPTYAFNPTHWMPLPLPPPPKEEGN